MHITGEIDQVGGGQLTAPEDACSTGAPSNCSSPLKPTCCADDNFRRLEME
jgi:hypothetical protein